MLCEEQGIEKLKAVKFLLRGFFNGGFDGGVMGGGIDILSLLG